MCVTTEQDKIKMINRAKYSRAVASTLTCANVENRLICGLLPVISCLEESSRDVVLCVLPETRPGDAATHMQTVLLQAFCFENDIPVIQVDSRKKLASYCSKTGRDQKGCSCALVVRSTSQDSSLDDELPPMTKSEQMLTDFYEDTLERYPKPIIELPI